MFSSPKVNNHDCSLSHIQPDKSVVAGNQYLINTCIQKCGLSLNKLYLRLLCEYKITDKMVANVENGGILQLKRRGDVEDKGDCRFLFSH